MIKFNSEKELRQGYSDYLKKEYNDDLEPRLCSTKWISRSFEISMFFKKNNLEQIKCSDVYMIDEFGYCAL